jgi:hypothetical protein
MSPRSSRSATLCLFSPWSLIWDQDDNGQIALRLAVHEHKAMRSDALSPTASLYVIVGI